MKFEKHNLYKPQFTTNTYNEQITTYHFEKEIEGFIAFSARMPNDTSDWKMTHCGYTFITRFPLEKDDVIDEKYIVQYVSASRGYSYAYLLESDNNGNIRPQQHF